MLKQMRLFVVVSTAWGLCGWLNAGTITGDEACVAAENWTREEAFQSNRPSGTVTGVKTVMASGKEIVHVVSFSAGGWVATATDDCLEPIVAFSKSGTPDTIVDSPFADILVADRRTRRIVEGLATTDDQEASVGTSRKDTGTVLSSSQLKWNRLLHRSGTTIQAVSNGRAELPNVVVAPLVTTKWSQGSIGSTPCYNYYTPDHLQSGCVATTMAQLMRYHRFPVTPVASRTYPCKLYGEAVDLPLMGGLYDWSAMVDDPQANPSEATCQAIGKLMYDCGVALGNEYKTYSSSAYTKNIVPALLETFGYSSAKREYLREETSLKHFNQLATNDLARARPVVISLHGENGGHSILVDGYGFAGGTLYYHLNFGWAGWEDVWYTLPNVQTTQSSYSLLQEIIYDVIPVDPSAGSLTTAADATELTFTRVTLDPAGGSVEVTQLQLTPGKMFGELPTPRHPQGATFLGWFTTPFYGERIVAASLVGTEDVTLYAHWQQLVVDPVTSASTKVSVTPETTDATRGKVSGGGTVLVGRTVSVKATASKGYAFAGWYTDAACTRPVVTVQTTDARTTSLTYTVTEADAAQGTVSLWAKFVMPSEDFLTLGSDFLPAEFVLDKAVELAVPVTSVSLPTVKVSGLPVGLKYEATTGLLKGVPTRPTARPAEVKFTVSNASGYQITRQYAISVIEDRTCSATTRAEVVSESEPCYPLTVQSAQPNAGTVTGGGVYVGGDKITLKATAAKGFVFQGWYSADVCCSQSASWTGEMPDEPTVFEARFVTTADDEASIRLGTEMWGELSPTQVLAVTNRCGVTWTSPVCATALTEATVKVSGLPSGLKFTAKDIVDSKTKQVTVPANTIYGTPTTASTLDKTTGLRKPSNVVFTVTTAGKSTQRYTVAWTVEPLETWAVGTFVGAALAEDGTVEGQSTVTVSAAGRISGKLLVGGQTWTLSSAAFEAESETGSLTTTLTGTCGKETFTDELVLSADDLGGCVRASRLTAVQNNWKDEPWKTLATQLAKKADQTISVEEEVTGEVVLNFGSAGTVKTSGAFITGVNAKGQEIVTKVSGSAVLCPLAVPDSETGSCQAEVVVYFPAKGTFPGWVKRLVVDL